MNELPEVLKAKDISKYLNCSPRYAYELMQRKDFPTLPVGRLKRVKREDFVNWIEKQKKSHSA